MNSEQLIEKMSAQDIPLKRFGAITIVNGLPVNPPPTLLTIRGGIQPTTGEDLVSLPEGQRERISYKIYSVTEMKTNKAEGRQKADVLTIYGEEYEVQQVQNHFGLGLNHWKAIATRLNKQ